MLRTLVPGSSTGSGLLSVAAALRNKRSKVMMMLRSGRWHSSSLHARNVHAAAILCTGHMNMHAAFMHAPLAHTDIHARMPEIVERRLLCLVHALTRTLNSLKLFLQ